MLFLHSENSKFYFLNFIPEGILDTHIMMCPNRYSAVIIDLKYFLNYPKVFSPTVN